MEFADGENLAGVLFRCFLQWGRTFSFSSFKTSSESPKVDDTDCLPKNTAHTYASFSQTQIHSVWREKAVSRIPDMKCVLGIRWSLNGPSIGFILLFHALLFVLCQKSSFSELQRQCEGESDGPTDTPSDKDARKHRKTYRVSVAKSKRQRRPWYISR